MPEYRFGYPRTCRICESFSTVGFNLQVAPFHKLGDEFRLMLIGQDPTITVNPERVKHVLMLNEPNRQLSRWLRDLLGEQNFDRVTLYATNLVKCTFEQKPSSVQGGALKFLRPYFEHCKHHLIEEIQSYQPDFVLTLGEAAHKLFVSILDNSTDFADTMQGAFTGDFLQASIGECHFDYSPSLHISTWRVAEVYGDGVKKFKVGVSSYFNK